MLNIGKLAVGGGEYYLEVVATGVEDYYLGAGEAPGYWTGAATLHLGLTGTVGATDLQAVLAGNHPQTGKALRAGHGKPRLPGFDLTFRAPKSVSLLWGLSDGDTSEQVRTAHDRAVHAAVMYLESEAAMTRRGAQGRERVPADGVVAAAFRHRTSRAGDPLLHTHVLIANLAHTCDDGRWRTLDARQLYRYAKTAGYLYQAVLRHELTTTLGVAWQPVVNGTADIDGVNRETIEHFSRRRADILNALAATGHSSAKAAQTATLATRQRKEYGVTGATLHDRWIARATAINFTTDQLTHREIRSELDDVDYDRVMADLAGPDGLTAQKSTFTRRDTLRAWCERLPRGASLATLHRLTDATMTDPDIAVPLPAPPIPLYPDVEHTLTTLADRAGVRAHGCQPLRGAVHTLIGAGIPTTDLADRLLDSPLDDARDPLAVLTWRARTHATHLGLELASDDLRRTDGDMSYSTAELLQTEQSALAAATTGVAAVSCDAHHVDTALTNHRGLAAEQVDMVRRITTDTAGVQVVVGPAGTGKTTALAVAVPLWRAAGCQVTGTALAARTAQHLGEEADIPATTLTALLAGLTARPAGYADVIVVDEAAMVDTRTLARLIDHTTARGARLVLVGDHHQLPEIGAGGLFAALARQLGTVTLTTNRRQHEPTERTAVDALRAGPPDAAVRHFTAPKRQIVHEHLEDAINSITRDWWTDRQAGLETAMLASNNHAVDALNAAARTRLSDGDQLFGPAITLNGRDYQVGDEILCLTNNRPHGLLNGTTARIDAIQDDVIHATTHDDQPVTIPRSYAEQGSITHAYATTVHKAQGRTLDTTHVLLDDTAYREMAYVMLSRHRHNTTLHACPLESTDDATHPGAVASTEVAEPLVLATRRSAKKTLAQSL